MRLVLCDVISGFMIIVFLPIILTKININKCIRNINAIRRYQRQSNHYVNKHTHKLLLILITSNHLLSVFKEIKKKFLNCE